MLVSHSLEAAEHFCDRAMLLEPGRCVEVGEPHHGGRRYRQLTFSYQARAAEAGRVDSWFRASPRGWRASSRPRVTAG